MAFVDIFMDTRPVLGNLRLDCTVSESHSFGVARTPYPVEQGAEQEDHIEDLPVDLTLEGLVSDIPPPGEFDFDFSSAASVMEERSKAAFEQLHQLMLDHEPFTVVTSLRTYENMMFADGHSLTITRDNENSNTLSFTANLSPKLTAYTSFLEAEIDQSLRDILGDSATSGVQSTETADAATADLALGAF